MDLFDRQRSLEVASGQSVPSSTARYEPPQVEVVVTADELEREALYAGFPGYGIA